MLRVIFVTLCLILIQATQSAHAEKRIALVIGNGAYERPGWALTNPTSDARLIADTLDGLGFDVTPEYNLSQYEMEIAFKAHSQRLLISGADTIGIIYYAGHGIESRGSNFLIPVDGRMRTEQEVWTGATNLDDALDLVWESGNRTNFVILDACRNNPLPSDNRTSDRGLANIQPAQGDGLLIAYATARGTKASDGYGTNSPYTTALANTLSREGLSAEQMLKRVARRVVRSSGGKQRPFYNSGLTGEDFYFARRSVGGFLSIAEDEMALFVAAREPCDYLDFLDRYPDSAMARNATTLSAGCSR